ncbi:MAG: Lipoprotein, partial [Candidatus Giovannonibacteria bacterium GW2011_GWB1_47_6b]
TEVQNTSYGIQNLATNETIERIGAFSELFVASLKVGQLDVSDLKLSGAYATAAYATQGSNYAEEMEISEDTEPGDIIAATPQGQLKAGGAESPEYPRGAESPEYSRGTEQFLVGVVSDSAGFIGNSKAAEGPEQSRRAIVGLLGQIRTKVSTEQGAISVGDPIAVSVTMPGVGVKSSEAGQVVGIALESFGDPAPVNMDDQQTSESISGFAVGKIMVFVNPHWIGGDLSVEEKDSQLVNLDPEQIRSALAGLGLAVDTEGTLTVKKIVAQNVEIGTPENPSGLTLYDENGNPRCVKVLSSGQLTSFDGTCEAITLANMDSATSSGTVTDTVSPTDTDITIISDDTTTSAEPTPEESALISSNPQESAESEAIAELVVDSTPPVIALLGEATISLETGATYIDAGAAAADDVDGDITPIIVVLNPVGQLPEP